jgi:hypothetical protein
MVAYKGSRAVVNTVPSFVPIFLSLFMHTLTEQPSQKCSRNVLNKLMLAKHLPGGPFHSLSEEDAKEIGQLSQAIAREEYTPSALMLTTGIGLSTGELPLRLPALLVPGLEMIRSFAQYYPKEELPKYLVYQATALIAKYNNLPEAHAEQRAKEMQQYIEEFIAHFYPDIQDQVVLQIGLPHPEEIEHLCASIGEEIRELCRDALEDVGQVIEQYKQRHSQAKEDTAYRYAAGNALYNGANEEYYPFLEHITQETKYILPIGGQAEVPFFHLTSAFAKKREGYKVLPLVTHSVGKKPTYYHYPKENDPTTAKAFGEALEHPGSLHGDIRKDVEVLGRIGLTEEVLQKLLSTSLTQ